MKNWRESHLRFPLCFQESHTCIPALSIKRSYGTQNLFRFVVTDQLSQRDKSQHYNFFSEWYFDLDSLLYHRHKVCEAKFEWCSAFFWPLCRRHNSWVTNNQAVAAFRRNAWWKKISLNGFLKNYFFLKASSAFIFFRLRKLIIAMGKKAKGKMVVAVKPFFIKPKIAEISIITTVIDMSITATVISFSLFFNSSSGISESCLFAILFSWFVAAKIEKAEILHTKLHEVMI